MGKNFAIFLLIFLVGCAGDSYKNFNEIGIDNGKKLIRIYVEIADDENEMAKGLMFRQRLDESSGMLFVFSDEYYRTFWMKNTLIPLDIIFIGNDFKIAEIKYAVPCREEPCILYKSSKPARYVLEVNGNFTIKNDIKVGNIITIQ